MPGRFTLLQCAVCFSFARAAPPPPGDGDEVGTGRSAPRASWCARHVMGARALLPPASMPTQPDGLRFCLTRLSGPASLCRTGRARASGRPCPAPAAGGLTCACGAVDSDDVAWLTRMRCVLLLPAGCSRGIYSPARPFKRRFVAYRAFTCGGPPRMALVGSAAEF